MYVWSIHHVHPNTWDQWLPFPFGSPFRSPFGSPFKKDTSAAFEDRSEEECCIEGAEKGVGAAWKEARKKAVEDGTRSIEGSIEGAEWK